MVLLRFSSRKSVGNSGVMASEVMWPAYVDHKVKISRNKMKLLCIKRWSALQRASNWRLVWIQTTTDAFIFSISFPLYLHSCKTKNGEIWSLNYAKYWWSQKIQFMRRFLATTKQEKLLLRIFIRGLVRIWRPKPFQELLLCKVYS